MATINDRITRLEDAFITLAEGQREFAAILKGLAEGQNALVEGQKTLIEGQKAIIATCRTTP